jgi:hypothetical protein
VTFEHRLSEFAGLPVAQFPIGRGAAAPSVAADAAAWRVRIESSGWHADAAKHHRDFAELFAAFLEQVDASRIVARLATLDLSLGTLGDEGAAALLAGQPLNHLERLDLHHHFLSGAMTERLREALPEVELDLTGQCEPTTWGGQPRRYIAVSE